MPMQPDLRNSAEFGWLQKKVHASRILDDMTRPATWAFTGTGKLSFVPTTDRAAMPALRVDMQMFADKPAPTRNRLSSVNLRRAFPGENWSGYNRISMWIRPRMSGFPMFPVQIVLHNDGREKVPDRYYREGIHYVMVENDRWQQVIWEITPLARDKVTMIEIGYWVNKMLAQPTDRVAFEIGKLELQRVDPDHFQGWRVAPGTISFSHSGYQTGSSKTALATGLGAREFKLLRLDGSRPSGAVLSPLPSARRAVPSPPGSPVRAARAAPRSEGRVVLAAPIQNVRTRLGAFQQMDFSRVRTPGTYVLQAGELRTKPFRIGDDVWKNSIWKAINFFFVERCGYAVPGVHGVDHQDWFATLGDKKIVMNGGWHDAGDLSQGLINTGEATYAMFALAERLKARGEDPGLVQRLIDEAKWGLDWVLKVRFPGGYRVAFASHNLWTNNIAGDEDDRSREAKNNPNANYIAAAAEAIAYRVLKQSDPELAARSLATAEDDWRHAIVGKEGPESWHTPAFAATPIELAGIGILASLELYQATRKKQYADKAVELARVIVASQQKAYVGRLFPLAGFFYTGPDRDTLFHQFHRGNDQAPIVALARLVEVFPEHAEWMKWYSTVALYAEYQKRTAETTQPYAVLPSYVYRDSEYRQLPDSGALHMATREAFREQVFHGMPMGEGYYLRVFPVWFARRGNYGILLSQAKALSTAALLRRDTSAARLAERQAQWIVGRNPFVQSMMWGEGYDWAQQYSVSSGDIVGALPVGMQSRGNTDLPYWPSQNMYVYKETWGHPVSRWLWLMADIYAPASRARQSKAISAAASPKFTLTATTSAAGEVTIRLSASGRGTHTFAVRSENVSGNLSPQTVTLRLGKISGIEWKSRVVSQQAPWVAVVVPGGRVELRQEVVGSVPVDTSPRASGPP